jgi:hypothetical protein
VTTDSETVVHARVRDANNTYTATAKCLRACFTAGAESAVQALARKVFPDQAASVEFVCMDRVHEIWRITGGG